MESVFEESVSQMVKGGGLQIGVVIPAYNEAKNLPYVLPVIPNWVHEVILVDGHSSDDTIEVACRLVPEIKIIQQTGKGKGDALRCGLAASTSDIVVMLDADGSTNPKEIERFVEVLLAGTDFAKGSRFIHDGGSSDLTPLRKLGNHILSSIVNHLFRVRFTDLCYGYNALWKRCLDFFEVDCQGFEVETLLSLRACKANFTIVEVPSYEHPRIHGTSNLHAFRDGLRVLKVIMKEWANGQSVLRMVATHGSPKGENVAEDDLMIVEHIGRRNDPFFA